MRIRIQKVSETKWRKGGIDFFDTAIVAVGIISIVVMGVI
jgi:hypothetical protein